MEKPGGFMILIDTNIFVDYLRNYQPAIEFFKSASKRDDVLFSAITEAELLAGSANNEQKKREILLQFLSYWRKIHVTNPIAVLAGDLSREYKLLIPDAIIAASAIINKAELVTRNINDFKHVKELKVSSPY